MSDNNHFIDSPQDHEIEFPEFEKDEEFQEYAPKDDFMENTGVNKMQIDSDNKLSEELKPLDVNKVKEEAAEGYEKQQKEYNISDNTITNDEEEERRFVTKMVEKKNKLEKEKRTNVLKNIVNIRKVNREMANTFIVLIYNKFIE